MAQVVAYQTAHGKRYRVRYRTPDRRQTDERGFKTKREAQAWANEVEVNKRRGEYVAPSLGRATVGELPKDWGFKTADRLVSLEVNAPMAEMPQSRPPIVFETGGGGSGEKFRTKAPRVGWRVGVSDMWSLLRTPRRTDRSL
jgi:hypothetical protein